MAIVCSSCERTSVHATLSNSSLICHSCGYVEQDSIITSFDESRAMPPTDGIDRNTNFPLRSNHLFTPGVYSKSKKPCNIRPDMSQVTRCNKVFSLIQTAFSWCGSDLISQIKVLLAQCIAVAGGFNRRNRGVIVAVAYAVFRLNKKAVSLSSISEAIGCSFTSARRYFLKMMSIEAIVLKFPQISTTEFTISIVRCCKKLKSSMGTNNICNETLLKIQKLSQQLVEFANNCLMMASRNFIDVVAACVYISSRVFLDGNVYSGGWSVMRRSQWMLSEAAYVAHVYGGSSETFRKRTRELRHMLVKEIIILKVPWADSVTPFNVVSQIPLILSLYRHHNPSLQILEYDEFEFSHVYDDGVNIKDEISERLSLCHVPGRAAADLIRQDRVESLAIVKKVIDINERRLVGHATLGEIEFSENVNLTRGQLEMTNSVLAGVSDMEILSGNSNALHCIYDDSSDDDNISDSSLFADDDISTYLRSSDEITALQKISRMCSGEMKD